MFSRILWRRPYKTFADLYLNTLNDKMDTVSDEMFSELVERTPSDVLEKTILGDVFLNAILSQRTPNPVSSVVFVIKKKNRIKHKLIADF